MRIHLHYLICLYFCAHVSFAQGYEFCNDCIHQKVQAYHSPHEMIITNSRNIMIDFLRDNKIDSLAVLMHYCDSVLSPDSSWLEPAERFLIGFFYADSAGLYNIDYYCQRFRLENKTKTSRKEEYCLRKTYTHSSPETYSDNLHNVLKLTAVKHLPELRKAYPLYADAWEISEQLELNCRIFPDSIQKILNLFRKKYPDSPFASLKKIGHTDNDFSFGFGMLFGQVFDFYPDNKSELMKNGFSTMIQMECSLNKWIASGFLSIGNTRSKSSFFKGTDTLPAGSPIQIYTAGLSAGRVFRFAWREFVVLNAGAQIVDFTLNPSFTELYPTKYKFSTLVCGTTGIDYNHFLVVSESGNVGMPIRLSFKIAAGKFSKISKKEGNIRISAALSFGLITFDASE